LKRSYEITKIKKAFVGFSWGYTDGIEVFFKNYLDFISKPIVTIYSKEDPKRAIDPIHSLMRFTAIDLERDAIDIPNLTPYPKPLPFLKRPAGQIVLTFGAISLLGLAPSAYEYIIGLSYSGKNMILSKKERRLSAEENRYKTVLKKKDEEIKSLDKAIDTINKEYNNRKGEITKVYDKKFKYSLRSEQLTLLTDILKKYEIASSEIKIDGDEYFVSVESNDDKKITSFVKKVVKEFNRDIQSINIEEISYDDKDKYYKGVLKVEFRKGKK